MKTEGYQDKEKICERCGKPFTWTANDQAFYAQMVARGTWQEKTEPKKCRPCKVEIKAKKSEGAAA